jgi:hypothetical protein
MRKLTASAIRERIRSGQVKEENVQVCSLDGNTGWQPAKYFGLDFDF